MNTPPWFQTLQERFSSAIAHAFVLHFNVRDYALPDAPLSILAYLKTVLPGRLNRIVAVYSRDRGIEFATEFMKDRAKQLLGLAQPANGAPANPARAALQAVGRAPAAADFPTAPADALALLGKLLASPEPVAVIIDRAELICPDAPLSQMSETDRVILATLLRWGSDPDIMEAGNLVILLAGNLGSLHASLREASARYEAIEIPLPGREERLAFIEYSLSRRAIGLADGLTPARVANSTAGLSLLNI